MRLQKVRCHVHACCPAGMISQVQSGSCPPPCSPRGGPTCGNPRLCVQAQQFPYCQRCGALQRSSCPCLHTLPGRWLSHGGDKGDRQAHCPVLGVAGWCDRPGWHSAVQIPYVQPPSLSSPPGPALPCPDLSAPGPTPCSCHACTAPHGLCWTVPNHACGKLPAPTTQRKHMA